MKLLPDDNTQNAIRLQFETTPLIPCIVQSALSKDVLMLAYMNREAFELTLSTQTLTFYSRSRASLWIKGETSGNTLKLISLQADCDADTLLAEVIPTGPTCHTGSTTCFGEPSDASYTADTADTTNTADTANTADSPVLGQLFNCILERKKEPKTGSYTNYLFEQGLDKILKKIGEEAAEIIIASKNDSDEALLGEAADFLYHLWVLLAEKNLVPEDLYQVLESRQAQTLSQKP